MKVQLAFAALLNIGFLKMHYICFPVLNCHSCPVSVFSCPIGVIGQFAALSLVPISVVGTIAVAGLFAGRMLCGWVCPFGALQDLLYKIPYVRFQLPSWIRFIKYGILISLVLAVPILLSPDFALYFCRLCPVATIESAIPWAIINGSTDVVSLAVRLVILFTIIVLVMGHHRFFCKALCPLGACLSFFNRFAAIFPERNTDCIDCGVCNTVCPMETKRGQQTYGVYDNRAEECISCLECRKKCPTAAIRIWG